ncbi:MULTISPECIES: ribosomal protein L7/L12 [unclassified Streptomyces]|uniref:ribosomal protein L7/L12 n=1 Tax=unclassified Streptomyces TaxID=2593676 RepID=UPI002033A472|nr:MULTISPECIES: ribosomal protein L7/L12 [unclassified Streptomyces]MCM2420135.1 ribosomal protein L7/L12 [Streptomyces sp. RKAG293]MCM2427655.1 ribosomal protein L7/L12 [Streptomyces sp. RKAG337]
MTYIVVLFALVGAGMLISALERKVDRVERRIRLMERRQELILRHLGIEEVDAPDLREINELVRQGKKIQAIKAYRELTGAGLKEAKEAVERLPGNV